MRAASVMLRPYNANLEVKPFDVLSCVDYGDVSIVPGYIDRSYAAIEALVAPIVKAGIIPLLIGGDHACTLPHLRATRTRGPVAVIGSHGECFAAMVKLASEGFTDSFLGAAACRAGSSGRRLASPSARRNRRTSDRRG